MNISSRNSAGKEEVMHAVLKRIKFSLLSISCILLIFIISGCKKKPADLPDHIKEKQARELKSKGQKKAKPVHDEDDGHGHAKGQEKREPSKEDFKEEEWPPEVLEAYRHAFSAGIVEMPEASRRLAR